MFTTPSFAGPAARAGGPAAVREREATRLAPVNPAWPVGLLGVPFDHVNKTEAVARIGRMIATRRPHYVVTANVDFLVQAQRDVELQRILLEADLVLCDGTPLLWASRWLGNPLPERVAGSDVVPLLIRAAARNGHRIFLLGAGPGVAAEAAARLQQQHPDLVIAGFYSPPFRDLLAMDFAEIARHVRAAKPDLLLVSFGCPKQEKWIAMHRHLLGVPVLIGVGATLDFIAGRMKRAPVLMQRTGTECLYRLAQEPRRLAHRYLGDFVRFVPLITRQCWHLRGLRRPAAREESMTLQRSPDGRQIRVEGDFSAAALNAERNFHETTRQVDGDCELDLSRVRSLDSTGVAVLVQWRRALLGEGRRMILINPSAAVRRGLQLMRLTGHFRIVEPVAGVPSPADAGPAAGQPVVPPYPGGHTLAWQGEVTAANAESVWGVTLQHFASAGPPPHRTFIIDLSQLRFIDSAGANLMGRLAAWGREQDRHLWFPGSQPDVRNVLRLAKLGLLLGSPHQ